MPVPHCRQSGAADAEARNIADTRRHGLHRAPADAGSPAAGWKVTHFNRGKTAADGVADVETLIGDRKGKLDALRGRSWDAVVDDTGFIPKYVQDVGRTAGAQRRYCLFISSISAYASFAKPNDEHSPTGKLSDPETEEITDDSYGPMKALCEQYSAEAFKGRASIVRPGYIVGPLDRSDRFTYWPVRASKGGEMLAPGTPRIRSRSSTCAIWPPG